MAGGYSVLNALNRTTRQQAEEKPCGRFRTKDINIMDIYPNGHNFYAMQDIEALAADIKAVGLLENLTVMYAPTEKGSYKLLGGERRWRALRLLQKQGYTEFSTATCQIRTAENEHMEMLEIIMCNRQRVKTVWEQIEEEKRLKETLQEMKRNKEPLKGYDLQDGRLRDTIASILSYSAAKVGQMETIANRLNRELYEALRDEKINFSAAYTIAKMDDAAQREVLQVYRETGTINSAQAREVVQPMQEAEEPVEEQKVECYEQPRVQPEPKEIIQPRPEKYTQPCAKSRSVSRSTGEYESHEVVHTAVDNHSESEWKPKTHYLKTPKTYFADIVERKRTFELLKNDRDYRVGDLLEMQEVANGKDTGNTITCKIKYLLEDYAGLKDDYCILGIGGITCTKED